MISFSRCLSASGFRGGVLVAALLATTSAVVAQDRTAFPAESLGVSSAALHQFLSDYEQWKRAPHRDDRRRDLLQQLQYIASGNLTNEERMRADAVERELRMEIDVARPRRPGRIPARAVPRVEKLR